jgi:SNF2 family DNA or RNA helicase
MLIHTKSEKILLNVQDPLRITTVIPTARVFDYKGRTLVAVPHRPDEVKILKNLGITAPNPILHYYDWPGQYKPFRAQLLTADFLSSERRAFCLSQMGCGKSMSLLWAYDFLRSIGTLNRALIISPLSTLERTWGDEIFRHFSHLNFSVLHGTRDKRLKLLEQEVDIYLINHDGLKTRGLLYALAQRTDIDLIGVDEIATFRNSSTDRWKCLNTIVNKQVPRWVWGLTGTPTPNAPTDAWAQCKLISPSRVPQYFGRFRDSTMRQATQYKWVPRDNALDIVHDAMQPAIRFKRSDCVDLPPVMYETRHAEMTEAQKKAYKLMLTKLAFEVGEGQVVAVNEAVKASKLVQVCCGSPIDTEGIALHLDCKNRIDVVKEIIEEAGSKVIVFVPFTGALAQVAAELSKSWEVAIVNGATSKHERDQIFGRFQHDSDSLRVLVANAGTMSHGLTLTAANTIVWFAPPNSNEIFEQACARITRPGQKLTQFIVMIEGSDIERRIYERLKNKKRLQGLFLEMVEGERGV